MNQIYLNGPSTGKAMSAEEFACSVGQQPGPNPCPPPGNGCGCGVLPAPPACDCCGGTAPGGPTDNCGQAPGGCQQMVCCCCRPGPKPQPPQVQEGCCCKQSFRAALSLLCDPQISSLLDFDTAAFFTNTYSAGTALAPLAVLDGDGTAENTTVGTPVLTVTPADNLGTLAGSFRRFAPYNNDLLDISADLYSATGTVVGLTATQVSLCELDAVVIQGAAAAAEGELTAAEVAARNFQFVRQLLSQRLNPCGGCGQDYPCACACDSRDCCCAAGLLSTLAQNNLSRRVSLAAGLLVLQNVTLLGSVGNVLVLSNDADNRLYFVCVNSVQFIG